VAASPQRTEMMDADTVAQVLAVLRARRVGTLDLTGGAPELNPHFRHLVRQARAMGVRVIDRCNLTILSEPGQDDLAAFLAQQGVKVVASLPCYLADNVDRQRGDGVFARSLEGRTFEVGLVACRKVTCLEVDVLSRRLDVRVVTDKGEHPIDERMATEDNRLAFVGAYKMEVVHEVCSLLHKCGT
jgi:organic radical activating enzyme